MKIAIVTDAWRPQINGVVISLENTIEHLTRRGHEILVIHPDLFENREIPFYPEIKFPVGRFGTRATQLLEDFAPDAVHIPVEGRLGWWARGYCIRNGIEFTTAYHTDFPTYMRKHLGVPKLLTNAVVRKFHSKSATCMVSNTEMQNELHRIGIKNTTLWGRGVDPEIFYSDGRVRQNFILSAGRVSKEKNLEALFAYRGFVKHKLGLDIVVVGDGPMLKTYAERYPEVIFVGSKTQSELAEIARRAKAFVFPSRSDTFGLVMAEAAMCGTPVAAYRETGPAAVVGKTGVGVLHDSLIFAITNALGLDNEWVAKKAKEVFSWEKATDQFEAALVYKKSACVEK